MTDTVMWGGKGPVNIDNPDHATFDLPSICRALSRKPRYGGFIEKNVTVGQHTLLAVKLAEYHVHNIREFQSGTWDSDFFVAEVLLHDFAEAFIGDVPKPIKSMKECKGIEKVEQNLMKEILWRWNPPFNGKLAYTRTETVELMHQIDFEAMNIEVESNGSPTMRHHFRQQYGSLGWKEDEAWNDDFTYQTLDRNERQVVVELEDACKLWLSDWKEKA